MEPYFFYPIGWIQLCDKDNVTLVDRYDKIFINSLPNNKILDVTKLKVFEDDRINEAQMMITVFDRVENFVEKEENAGYQHFLLFTQCFQKDPFLGVVKSPDCVVKS